MGIYAPGITKPDHCCNCQFCEDSTDDCLLQNDAHWSTYSEQIKNCPLIEIHEPHGDLIDRKAPEIIFCKDCRKHNVKVGFDENFHTVWKEDACPLVDWRGKAKEHEFDYQYCAFAERRTDG